MAEIGNEDQGINNQFLIKKFHKKLLKKETWVAVDVVIK